MPQITVNDTPTPLFNMNAGRLTVTIRNSSAAAQIIYFWLSDQKGLTMAQADYVLAVNEEKTFVYDFDGEDMRQPISAIASAAGALVTVGETSTHPPRR